MAKSKKREITLYIAKAEFSKQSILTKNSKL